MASGASAWAYARVIKRCSGNARKTDKAHVTSIAGGSGGNVIRRFAQRVRLCERTVVTSEALTSHDALRGRVSEFRSAERTPRRVTDIARKRSGNVIRRFKSAGCAALAVTAGATARFNGDVGKAGAGPSGGAMTSVAGFGGRHVIRRFTFSDVAIVALSALMRRYTRVTEKSDAP